MTTVHFLKAKFHRFFTPVRNLNQLGYSKNSRPRSKDTPILYSYPNTKTNQICGLGNQELDPKLAYNMELANSALHVSCLVGKKKPFWILVAETETRTGTGTRSRTSLLLELEYPDHRCLILEKPELELEQGSYWNWNHSTEPASF